MKAKDDLYKFRPAMAYMLDHMIDRYPNVEIYFLLNSGLKEEFNESVRTICRHYNIDCIELHGEVSRFVAYLRVMPGWAR